MKDRSDDPSHHERTLIPWSYISLRERERERERERGGGGGEEMAGK